MKPLLKTASDVDPHEAHYELMQRRLMDNPPPKEDPGEQSTLDRLKVHMGNEDPVRRYQMRDVDDDTLAAAARQADEYGEDYISKVKAGDAKNLPKTPIGQRK